MSAHTRQLGCILERPVRRTDRRTGTGHFLDELSKHFHPLESQGEDNVLYNTVNCKIAPSAVNVADAGSIEDNMLSAFRRSLPSGFNAKLSSPVKTMEYLKRIVKVGEETVFDADSISLRIMMVG